MDNPLLFKNQQSQYHLYLLYQKLIERQPVVKELSLYLPSKIEINSSTYKQFNYVFFSRR